MADAPGRAGLTKLVAGHSLRCLAEFNRELGKTEELCKKLKLVLATIERDRSRFPHVDDRELGLRRTSVAALDRVSCSKVLPAPAAAAPVAPPDAGPIRATAPFPSVPLPCCLCPSAGAARHAGRLHVARHPRQDRRGQAAAADAARCSRCGCSSGSGIILCSGAVGIQGCKQRLRALPAAGAADHPAAAGRDAGQDGQRAGPADGDGAHHRDGAQSEWWMHSQ